MFIATLVFLSLFIGVLIGFGTAAMCAMAWKTDIELEYEARQRRDQAIYGKVQQTPFTQAIIDEVRR